MLLKMPDGKVVPSLTITNGQSGKKRLCAQYGIPWYSGAGVKPFLDIGAEKIAGFQIRYIKILDNSCKLTCEALPYSAIQKAGAGMYKGEKRA
jgi:hypothetical protein